MDQMIDLEKSLVGNRLTYRALIAKWTVCQFLDLP